jgi:hypothetical protein
LLTGREKRTGPGSAVHSEHFSRNADPCWLTVFEVDQLLFLEG